MPKVDTLNPRDPALEARDTFRDAENLSTEAHQADDDAHGSDEVTANQNGSGGFYRGQGKAGQSTAQKIRGLRKNKFIAVILTLFGITGLGGGMLFGSTHSLLAPAIESLFTEATDTQYASNSLRTVKLMRRAMQGTVNTTWTGAKKYAFISPGLKRRLAANDIEVESEGTFGRKTLVYTNADGNRIEISADEFEARFRDDLEFRDAFTKAKRGRVLGFFDNIANGIFTKLGISRNLFDRFRQDADETKNKAEFDDTATKKLEGGDSKLETATKREVETEDPDNPGKTKTSTEINKDDASGNKGPKAESNTKAAEFADSIVNTTQMVTNLACGALQAVNLISATVAATEIYDSINYAMLYLENISKMKSGDGNNSAINTVLNDLTTASTTEVDDYAGSQVSITSTGDSRAGFTVDNAGTVVGKTTETGSPLESAGAYAMLTKTTPQASKTRNYSIERIGSKIGGALTRAFAVNSLSMKGCAILQGSAAAASIVTSILTFGSSTLINIAISASISVAVSAILSFAIPTIAKALFTNMMEDAVGIPAGEYFARGTSAMNTRLGRNGSGQSLSSESAALAYNKVNNEVLAMDAELDRYNYSPFDITNQNTFFGSIAYSLLPSLTYQKTTGVSTIINSSKSAIANLISPNVKAAGAGSSYMTTFGTDCSQLESIGAVGDIYCNPITTTDVGLMDIDPESDAYWMYLTGTGEDHNLDCDDNGQCAVVEKSDLAYYIQYCDNRDSPFGISDTNIAANFEGLSTGNGAIDAIIGAIPIIGDVVDVWNTGQKLAEDAYEWASGEYCVNGSTNPKWGKIRYYQRYIEDQRILDQLGVNNEGGDEETPTLTNPISDFEKTIAVDLTNSSREEILAHYAGISVEQATLAFSMADYGTFLANYDVDSRTLFRDLTTAFTGAEIVATIESSRTHFDSHMFGHNGLPITESIFESDRQNHNSNDPTILIAITPIYADLRSRTYTV